MLDKTKNTSSAMAPSIRTIGGQTVAKTKKWTTTERADLAAKYKLGLLNVTPTAKQAANLFRVSVQLVAARVGELETRGIKANRAINGTIDHEWASLPAAARDDFVRRSLLQIWDTLEKVTA